MEDNAELIPEEKQSRKKKKEKKVLRTLGIILAVILVFSFVTGIIGVAGVNSNINKAKMFPRVNVPLDITNIGDGEWDIRSDDDLKIVQLTDVHLGGGWMSTKKDAMALNAVAAMLSAEKPDFVIVTGDISYPVPFQAGTLNNKHGAKMFAELMETLGIYWTLSYGNHDTEAYSYFSREQLTDFYSKNYPHCLLQPGPDDVDGCGNQVFNIVNSDGVVTRSLIIMDSHSYINGDILGVRWQYDNIHDNQVEWYENVVEGLRKRNIETVTKLGDAKTMIYKDLRTVVPTSIFMHIPLVEYHDAWTEYADAGYQDTKNVKLISGGNGEANERVFCGVSEDGLFEKILELGSTDYIFSGHDHLNTFSLNYKGIYLTYGMSVDYLAYIGISRLGTQRGCTVIDIDSAGNITRTPENYYQEKYISFYEKEPVTMQTLGNEKTAETE